MRESSDSSSSDRSTQREAGAILDRLEGGACVREMMRRGEIGGQALGLLQLVASHRGLQAGSTGRPAFSPAEAN